MIAVVNVVLDEADRNSVFRNRLEGALGIAAPLSSVREGELAGTARRRGRRAPALLDPIELARQSEQELRDQLSRLGIEQLRDIVAQYGMDPGKLVMKWKHLDRITNRIVELAIARARKGEAFREG